MSTEEAPAVDPLALDELRAIDPNGEAGLVEEVIREFLLQLSDDLPAIRRAVEAGDAPAVAHIAHRLKGAAAQVGAAGMAGLCQELVVAGRAGSLEPAPDLVNRLDREAGRVRGALGPPE